MHSQVSNAHDEGACGCHRHVEHELQGRDRRSTNPYGFQPESVGAEIRARLSRRGLLKATITSAAAGVLARAGAEVVGPGRAQAASSLNPQAVLQALMDGNRRYIERRMNFFEEDLAILRQNTRKSRNLPPAFFPVRIPASRSS